MLNTKIVVDLLLDSKPMSFDKIWAKIKTPLMAELNRKKEDEMMIKNDFLLSMLQDEKLIMIGNNTWSIRSNYSMAQQKTIHEQLLGDELKKVETDLENDDQEIIEDVIETMGDE